MTGPDEGGLPSAEELFGPERVTFAEIAAEALRQLGEPPMPGYGDHRRRQYQGLPDVSGLVGQIGL